MKRLAFFLMLLLTGCSEPKHDVWYFVPSVELSTGEIPSTNTLPLSSLAKCEDFAKNVYEPSVANDPDVIAHGYNCVRSPMPLAKPTEQPGMTKSSYGSI